jgi:hypothetical protein
MEDDESTDNNLRVAVGDQSCVGVGNVRPVAPRRAGNFRSEPDGLVPGTLWHARFCLLLRAAGVLGNFSRNSLRSRTRLTRDLALRRRFDLTEWIKLDIRAEYFNVQPIRCSEAPWANPPDTRSGFGLWQGKYYQKRIPDRRNRWADRASCMRRVVRDPRNSR